MSSAMDSPEDISYQLIVFVSLFTPLEIVLVGLRFYARSLTVSKYGFDDWLVFAALIGQIVAGGIALGGVRDAGFGRHIGYLEQTDPEAIVNLFKYLVAIPVWYHFTVSISKIAICLLYHRLFPQKAMTIALYTTIGIMVTTAIASLITDFLACRPFDANWAPLAVQATKCINKEALYVWSTLPNIITDAVLLVLPIPIIWKLQVTSKLKLALAVTFIFGGIGLVASILRFAAFANHNSFVDATFTAVELAIWTVAEPGIYLVAACLMVFRPLLEKVHTSTMRGTTTGGSTNAMSRFRSRNSRMQFNGASRTEGKSIPLNSHGTNSQRDSEVGDVDASDRFHERDIVVTTNVHADWQQV